MRMQKNIINTASSKLRVAIVSRVIFHYRVGIYDRLAKEWNLMVFHGKSVPKSKVVNAPPPYPFKEKTLFTICKRAKNNPMQILYFNPGCVFALLRWKPDFIILEGSNNMLNNIFIFFYCKLFSKKYLWWGIGQVPGRKDSIYRKMLTPARKFIIRHAACCLAYCNLSAEYFRTITDSLKIKVIPNSIDNEAVEREIEQIKEADKAVLRENLGISEDSIILLFVGALEANKRLDVFLETIGILNQRGRKVYALIIGSGNAEADYRKAAERLSLKNCKFLGQIVKGVNIYFQIADIFILPGRGGLAINQALVNGLPVICNTPADGTELDMIENKKNGLLIESMSVPKLTEAIEYIMQNKRYVEMGRNAIEVVKKKYNINVMTDIFRKVMDDLSMA